MRKLVSGYKKFRSEVYPSHQEEFVRLSCGQKPRALFVTCSDSRIVPDMLMQSGPGELFICRNAGNIVPAHGDQNGGVSATIEYAVRVLEVKHIILCGHSDCGVMRGLLHPENVAALPNVSHWLSYGARARAVVDAMCKGEDDEYKVMELARQNVLAQMDNLRTHPSVAAAMASRGLQLHGWLYNIGEGAIEAWSQARHAFVPLDTLPVEDLELVTV